MGLAKREHERLEACEGVAGEIAVRAGAAARCDFCDALLDVCGDLTGAYRLGNVLVTRCDPMVVSFTDRREMTDMIRDVVAHAPLHCECPTARRCRDD